MGHVRKYTPPKPPTAVLYLRVPTTLQRWLDSRARRDGVSLTAYAIAILETARRQERLAGGATDCPLCAGRSAGPDELLCLRHVQLLAAPIL